MYQYFKMLENYTSGIKPYESIKDLTFAIADSGGYYRKEYRFGSGSVRERTMYTKKFDSILVSMWLLHYKTMFIGKLSKRKDLIDYHVQIINRTFFIVMGCLDKEKVNTDNAINQYVTMSLVSRINEASKRTMSKYYSEPYKKGEKYKFIQKDAVLNQSLSIDSSECLLCEKAKPYNIDEMELDVRYSLKDNPFGDKVFDYLLSSRTKANYKDIDEKIGMKKSDCTYENKMLILDAINTIRKVFFSYINYNKRFRSVQLKAITYSFEGE